MKNLFSLTLIAITWLTLPAFSLKTQQLKNSSIEKAAEKLLKKQILTEADWAMKQEPVTVTAYFCPRSTGGKHDFFFRGRLFLARPEKPGRAVYQSRRFNQSR